MTRNRTTTQNFGLRYAWQDLTRNKGVNAALLVVLVLSAFLMATGAMVIERLSGSVGELFDQAKPPHFLQMHKGDYDQAALTAFAANHPRIESWLVTQMVDYDSNQLTWSRASTGESGSLSSSPFDNLFVTQNEKFDYLVDSAGNIPQPAPGEVYVPVKYQQAFGIGAGDQLTIQTKDGPLSLQVQGVVKDAQMAASLSSATRVLVSPQDFAELTRRGGTGEIIVEYRLRDAADANAFQSAYEADPALPKNGPAITDQQIRIINTFSDGLVAVALMLVSLILVAIALLSLRFVIVGKLQDEVRELGAMKAIGIPNRTISGIYLAKYGLMTLVACVVGGVLAIFATALLTRGIQANYAAAPITAATFLAPLIGLAVLLVIVVGICARVLGRLKRIEVVNALVHGSILTERQSAKQARRQARLVRHNTLGGVTGSGVNRQLVAADLRATAGQWLLIPIVFALATVLITLPTNLLTTFQSPQFVTYMGAPDRDLAIDVQYQPDVDAVRNQLLTALQTDDRLTGVEIYATVLYQTDGSEGPESLPIDVGDYSGSTVKFSAGSAPKAGQIALSALNGQRLQRGVGDQLTIYLAGQPKTVEVSGIYQDVTAGGLTAKMQGEIPEAASAYTFYSDVANGLDPATVATDLKAQFPTAAVYPMRDYMSKTLSGITDAFTSAAWLALIFGLAVAALITTMFLKLRLSRDRRDLGVLYALGFSNAELVGQLRTKTLLVVAIGIAAGLLFAGTAGQAMVGGALSAAGLGITNLAFLPNPWLVYVLYPLLLLGAGYLGVALLAASIRKSDKSQWLKA